MQTTIIIGLAIGLLVYMAWAAKKPGEAMTTIQGGTQRGTLPVEGGAGTLEDLYQCHGRQKGLDPMLLKAIAIVESSENPNAKNPADPSYGLMQLLCQPDGQGGCRNQLNVIGWPPSSVEQLYDPDYSLHIGAQILRWNIDRYGFKKGIAVYNSWSAHNDPQDGPFSNQGYVDKVLRTYYSLTGTVAV